MAQTKKKADQYNDPTHNYLRYWDGREYEHAAEELAISRLLNGKSFAHAADVGGGYGRLCIFLEHWAAHVTLAEPSQQQLDIAAEFLKDHPEINRVLTQADDLKFDDESLDLLTMIRVMHHLPDPTNEFKEIKRVLKHGGYAIIEVANYAHMRNRIKHAVKLQKLPTEPVDIRSEKNKREEEIPFVNHNPKVVKQQLAAAGLHTVKVLSVSNLRSVRLKKMMSPQTLLRFEKMLQTPLSPVYFGPSIFFLVKKH